MVLTIAPGRRPMQSGDNPVARRGFLTPSGDVDVDAEGGSGSSGRPLGAFLPRDPGRTLRVWGTFYLALR